MRTPLKLNKAGWPGWLCAVLPSMDDPRGLAQGASAQSAADFSCLVSTIKLGGTWRTTQPKRHGRLEDELCRLLAGSRPSILDVGASDGSTSLDMIQRLGDDFSAYYVTDRFLEVTALASGGRVYVYGPGGEAIMAAGTRLVAYDDMDGADPLSRILAARLLAAAPPAGSGGSLRVSLIQPALESLARKDPRIKIQPHDIFEPWPGPPLDLVKAANILNPCYFDQAGLEKALANLINALAPSGRLAVVDNDPQESYAIYRHNGQGEPLSLEKSYGPPVRAAQVVESLKVR